MAVSVTTLESVKAVLVRSLGLSDRAESITAATPLFGAMPELDSLAVVELAAALEERFGFSIEDDDFTADVFESVGTLAQFVDARLA